ncbi:hypothetical protein D9M72_214390 [compost metagenome]
MVTTLAPMPLHTCEARCTLERSVVLTGVSTTWRPVKSEASACSMPETSLPAIGWAGTKFANCFCRPLRAASITSPLVEPTSITSVSAEMPWRMALKVASEAATGTASSTMSAPDTASSAEGAATSITPSWRARSVVEGDLL